MKIWLDDERPMPQEFNTLCRHPDEVINHIKNGGVTLVSLDNDLGPGYPEGYEVAKFIEEFAFEGGYAFEVRIHTANPTARNKMKQAIRNAIKFWSQNKKELPDCWRVYQ